jgi:hypothetical protein
MNFPDLAGVLAMLMKHVCLGVVVISPAMIGAWANKPS